MAVRVWAAPKPTGVFSALARRPASRGARRRGQRSGFRVQGAATCCAQRARPGMAFYTAPLRGGGLPVFCRPPVYRRRAVGFPVLL